jgi:hypothetical protein
MALQRPSGKRPQWRSLISGAATPALFVFIAGLAFVLCVYFSAAHWSWNDEYWQAPSLSTPYATAIYFAIVGLAGVAFVLKSER